MNGFLVITFKVNSFRMARNVRGQHTLTLHVIKTRPFLVAWSTALCCPWVYRITFRLFSEIEQLCFQLLPHPIVFH